MFTVMALTFGLGFLLRPAIGKPYNKYLPFVVSVYEGGMIAYPLYTSLVGAENLSVIAMIDISGLLFCFGIFCNVLVQMEEQTKVSVGNVVVNALKNPAFIATVLGVIVGLTGEPDAGKPGGTGVYERQGYACGGHVSHDFDGGGVRL